MLTIYSDGTVLGSYQRPIEVDAMPETYPKEHMDKPYIYLKPKGGAVVKFYRSYSDYCD